MNIKLTKQWQGLSGKKDNAFTGKIRNKTEIITKDVKEYHDQLYGNGFENKF